MQNIMSTINKKKFKHIYIEITNACNLKCSFCPSASLTKRKYVDKDDFQNIIFQVKNYTNTVYLHILGEPLLHPNFKELVECCKKNNIRIRLTTNGTLLHQYDFSTLSIQKFNISLQALENMNHEERETYFLHLKQWFEIMKPKLIQKECAIDFRLWNDKQKEKNKIRNDEIKTFLKKDLDIQSFPQVRVHEENEFAWPNEEGCVNEHLLYCKGGRTHLGILTSGEVVLCCLDYQGKTCLGNIYEESLEKILKKEPYIQAMQCAMGNKPYFQLCKNCTYRNRFE